MKYIVLPLIYAYVIFMAWSAFGWLGVAYAVFVPIPLLLFSYFVRARVARGKAGNIDTQQPMSIWSSPIPYFSVFFVVLIGAHIIL